MEFKNMIIKLFAVFVLAMLVMPVFADIDENSIYIEDVFVNGASDNYVLTDRQFDADVYFGSTVDMDNIAVIVVVVDSNGREVVGDELFLDEVTEGVEYSASFSLTVPDQYKNGDYALIAAIISEEDIEDMFVAEMTFDFPSEITKEASDSFYVDDIGFPNGLQYFPGEDVAITVAFKNDGGEKMDGVKILATIPELGISRELGPFDLKNGQKMSRSLALSLPEDSDAGQYTVIIDIVGNDRLNRRVGRQIEIS